MSQRRESFLRISQTDGDFAVMVELAQQSTEGEGSATLGVPMCDFFVLALAKLLAAADPAVESAVAQVMDAYKTMADEPDAAQAAEAFNAVIGVEVYRVQSIQEDAS